MKPPLFVRELTGSDRRALQAGLRSREAFALRRAQILLASADGRDGSLPIHQDASVYATIVEPGNSLKLDLKPGRAAWVHVARGSLEVNGQTLQAGDGVALTGEKAVALSATAAQGEAIVFDLA